jgi:hypothetical protein
MFLNDFDVLIQKIKKSKKYYFNIFLIKYQGRREKIIEK